MSRASLRTAFAGSMYEQFNTAYSAGVRGFECHIPVVSEASNRITLGADARELPKMPHTVSIGRHPVGRLFHVAIESSLGLACPDPLEALGLDVAHMNPDNEAGPQTNRYRGLLVISGQRQLQIRGADYAGELYLPIRGVDTDMQQLFVAQVAGVAVARATELQEVV